MKSILEKSYEIKNSSETIKFYEDNKLYFDNYDKITDIKGIEDTILIKQKYCEAIERKSHLKDAAIVLKHIFILLDKLKGNSEKYEYYYERALFYEGVILGRQKKYKESNDKFKRLIILDPKNENYQDWFKTNKESIIDKKLDVCYYLIPAIGSFIIVTKEKFAGKYYWVIATILFVILAGILIYNHFIKKRL